MVGVAILITSAYSYAADITLDQILDKYYKAAGIDKLQQVKTIVMSGILIRNDAMPYKVYRVRPNKYRMERDVADITGLQVFDGQNGWSTAPWSGNPKPQPLSGDGLTNVMAAADFDGILYRWKDKGHSVEYVGLEDVCYKLKVTRKDGGIEHIFINQQTFLIQKRTASITARGQQVEFVTYFKDYRNVNGIMFAFENENTMGGQPYSTIQFDSVELNIPVDEKIFVMPV